MGSITRAGEDLAARGAFSAIVQRATGPDRPPDEEIDTFQRWQAAGSPEGNPADSPPRPQWTDDWPLGTPDLVVQMPRPYELGPEGPDLYRNFVVPIPLTTNRFVRAIEFRPGNARIVHHTFIKVDKSGESRRL